MTTLSNIVTPSNILTTTNTKTVSNKTLTDPKISLGGSSGEVGQALLSQGSGNAPTWGSPGISTGKSIAMAMIFGG